jgi:hypothetical protein
MPAALAVPAIIGAGASVAQGVIGARGASGAARTQAQAAGAAGDAVQQAAAQVNPQINAAGQQAAQNVQDAAVQANAGLNPYMQTGGQAATTLGDLLKVGGDFNRDFTAADLQMDPGYQFRLQEGMKALERSAAARGGATGGAALKAITRFGQDMASQEFGAAFDRFRANRGDRFNMLNTLSNSGQQAATQAGNNTMQGAQFGSSILFDSATQQARNTMGGAQARADALTGAGNARAAGQVGSANAYGSMAGSIGNSASEALLLRELMKR